MNTQHTPGPWQVAESPNHHSPFITNATGKGTIANSVHGATSAEQEANARLIAAAPDLLAELEWLVEFFDKYPPYFSDGKSMSVDLDDMNSARAAIAKATQP